MKKLAWISMLGATAAGIAMTRRRSQSSASEGVAGRRKGLITHTLETGARVLQKTAPLNRFNIYLVGFHPMKDDPQHQMEAHHFCHQMNEDFAQCVLFDGNGPEARLNGIEYIISERLFDSLPEEEKQYWHPHNYEILSGQLVAPKVPELAEHELMLLKMNSYGKTWHVWDTSGRSGRSDIPMGAPMLAWSFNRDGEVDPELISSRDRSLGISTDEKRRHRQDLVRMAHPQCGVAALLGRFNRSTEPIPGVVDLHEKSRAATGW